MGKLPKRMLEIGQGMVEFAIVFPLLLLLVVGIFEFGRMMFTYSAAIAATREAARYGAAIQDIGGGIPQYEDCQGIREAAKKIGKFAGIDDGDITIQYSDDSGVYATSCPPGQEVGLTDSISVTVNTGVSPLSPLGYFGTIPISSSSSRTILKKIQLGESGTGAGSLAGAITDVNFKTTSQTATETKGTIVAVLELNQAAADLVTIPFSVTGTAVLGTDYSITTSPVTINPGDTTATIFINLINDAVAEGDETLFIGIGTPTNATKGPQNIHMVTIVDPPFVTFTTANSVRNESETISTLSIELSKGSAQDVTVTIASAGSATWGVGGDYQTIPNPIVIPAGSLNTTLTVMIFNDLIDEDDELAVLGLGSTTNAILGAIPMHLMTIVDDDLPPEVSFFTANQVVSEEIGIFTTSVTLSEVSTKTITVPYSTSGTTIPADYLIHNPSPLIFPPGTKTVDINMDVLEGDGWEEDETLVLTLGTPQNASLGTPNVQTIVITESSGAPFVFFAEASQSIQESNYYLDVIIQMSNAWNQEVTIPYVLSGTAINGADQDYQLSTSSLMIPVGFTQGIFQVQINDDDLDESDESLVITMGEVSNGTASAPSVHTILILDDDSPPLVNFASIKKNIMETGGTFSITLVLSQSSDNDITVPLALSGSAAHGIDYTITTTSVVIPSGYSSKTFDISIIDDVIYDPAEQIVIDLGAPTNAVLGSETQYRVYIEDDELPLCKVGTHMLTVGINSLDWSVTNKGEELVFTGGSVTWPQASPNEPRLTNIQFAGNTVFSGGQKPPSYSYFAWQSFAALNTTIISYRFDGTLGTGDHILVANFQNADNGTTCNLTETYHKH